MRRVMSPGIGVDLVLNRRLKELRSEVVYEPS